MKFTQKDISTAIGELSMLRWFPSDEGARVAVRTLLAKICPSLEALRWLVDQMALVGEWQGPRELRAVLCRKFTPADGVVVKTPKTSEEIAEAYDRMLERNTAEWHRKMAEWKAAKALNPGEYAPLRLEGVVLAKPMPKPKERVTVSAGPSLAELEAELEREMAPPLSDEERERRAAELRDAVRRRTA